MSKREATPTARFWIWHIEGWVKLSLRPGQVFDIHGGGPTDEGYSCHAAVYTYEHGVVTCETTRWGRDCDGRYESGETVECPVALLAGRPAYAVGDWDGAPIPGIRLPEWEKKGYHQRDYTAEAAGY